MEGILSLSVPSGRKKKKKSQRGGSPSAGDRILASRLGVGAIQAILEGQRNVMIGIKNDEVVYVPFSNAIKSDKIVKKELIDVLAVLSI